MVDGYAGAIDINAESLGGATVARNTLNGIYDNAFIRVRNAAAPVVTKNKVLNSNQGGSVISVSNCSSAVVSGNKLSNINDAVDHGIYVQGNNARVSKNNVSMLLYYDGD